MKVILTTVILLTATLVFAEDNPQAVLPVTNSVVSTNETESYKPGKAWTKSDARTGATRKSKKQK